VSNRRITRRNFLKVAAVIPMAGALVPGLKSVQSAQNPEPFKKVRVVLVRDKNALDASRKHNPDVIQKMLDDAVTALLGENDPVKAWKLLIKPNIGNYIPTGEAVEQALKRRVMDTGVSEDSISIDDRGVLVNPIFKKATALVNARPARSPYWAGMGSCNKNYITFVPVPSDYHPDTCANLATIWYLRQVKDRTRLNVLVMLAPLFHGIGPHHHSKGYTWEYKGLIVSRDPVAADSTGLRILQAKRRQHFGDDRPMQADPAPHLPRRHEASSRSEQSRPD